MWLVLCSANDYSALWAARGLKSCGLLPLEIVSPESLAYNLRFDHRIITSETDTKIALADGRVIDSATVCGTLNRLQLVPFKHLRGASQTDRQYAEQEIYSLFLSWLYGLQGVMLNRPTPQGLCGAWRHLSEWVWLATKAGLSTPGYKQSGYKTGSLSVNKSNSRLQSLVVVNDNCFGASASLDVKDGCVRLSKLCSTPLLGIDFQVAPKGEWIFTNATPMPDLTLGGALLLRALANGLRQ